MPEMTDRQILQMVNSEFESAMGSSGGEISIERAKSWDYYLSKELGNEVEGQSRVVTSDVSDVVDSIMPSLLRIFTTQSNLVNFDAVGPEDEEQASQESDYVNYVFFKQNPAFTILYDWFFDALTQKNGIVKAYLDESERVIQETYEGLTEAELFSLLEDDELEPKERDTRVAETVDDTGNIVEETLHDVTFERTTSESRVRVDPVPPEEYRISSDAKSIYPDSARMVGHERDVPRSELIAMGFDEYVVESLSSHGEWQNSEEEISRYNKTDERRQGHPDKSQDLIQVREAYIKLDRKGDGKSELLQVFTAGNELLSKEPVDRQPFHVISPQPLPHKHFGRATAEKVMDIQKINTTLTRQILDNLYHTNNPGHAVWEQGLSENTLDDLLSSRIGSVTRFQRPIQESWAQMTVPFTAGQTFPMLEWFEKTKRDRTGVSADSEGLNPEQLKNIQTSVLAQANDLSRMKIEAIARIFAETGIKSLFLHIHELLLKYQKKPQIVQLRNQWVQVDPQQWRDRTDMSVQIGLGIGSREQNMLHLNDIWDKQRQMVEAGGMNLTVSPRNIFNTARELVKNANLSDPTMFFTDPGDQEMPPQASEQQQLLEQQNALQQRQQELEIRKQQIDAQESQLQEQRHRQEMLLEHQREIEKMRIEREKNRDNLAVQMEKIANQLTQLELEHSTDVPGSKV